MKKKVLVKKLGLNKFIISNLNTEEKTNVKGGVVNTYKDCSKPYCMTRRLTNCISCYPCPG